MVGSWSLARQQWHHRAAMEAVVAAMGGCPVGLSSPEKEEALSW
jgi:hypothetical protein